MGVLEIAFILKDPVCIEPCQKLGVVLGGGQKTL